MIKHGDKISVAMISMNEEGSIKKIVQEIFNIDIKPDEIKEIIDEINLLSIGF